MRVGSETVDDLVFDGGIFIQRPKQRKTQAVEIIRVFLKPGTVQAGTKQHILFQDTLEIE